jgi:Wadjet protein JetA
LQTTDHVSRYRPGIIEATAQLERSGQIEDAARRLFERGDAPSIAVGVNRLIEQARLIREQFQELDNLFSAIQTRHSQFVDSAVRTVELQLASNTTTSGQLHAILTAMLKGRTLRDDDLAALVNLFQLGFVEQESLAAPGRAPVAFVPEAIAPPLLSPAELEATQEETLRALNRAVSRERVRRYVRALLADRDEITSDELPLAGPEDLPLLIYLREYGNGALGYRLETDDDATWVERNGIGFRRFLLRKHELDAEKRG